MIEKAFRLIVVLVVCALTSPGLGAQADPRNDPDPQPAASFEYLVKAAFLYNFAKFAKWPAETFPDPHAPLHLCILGKDLFGAALDTIEDKTIEQRKLHVDRLAGTAKLDGCHVLFVSASEEERLREIFAALDDKPVLTIADMPNFARMGGVIRLKTVENKIRFEINIDAARRAGLRISSKVLRLGEIVWDEPARGAD